jgi:hypothetical protein
MAQYSNIVLFERVVCLLNIRRDTIISFRKYIRSPTSNIKDVGFFIVSSVLIGLLGISGDTYSFTVGYFED